MKYVWKFQKLCFRNKDRSRSSKIWPSHPNRPFKTTLCTFSDHWCFCHRIGMGWWHSSYFDFITCKPWHECLVCYFFIEAEATNIVVLSKVSRTYPGISCRFPSLSFVLRNQPTSVAGYSLFPELRRREKELRVKLNPCAHLGRQNILQQHVYQRISQITIRLSEVRYRVDVTSLLVPSLSIAPFWIQYGGKFASNWRFRPPFKRCRNAE